MAKINSDKWVKLDGRFQALYAVKEPIEAPIAVPLYAVRDPEPTPIGQPLYAVKDPEPTPIAQPLYAVKDPKPTPIAQPLYAVKDPEPTPVSQPLYAVKNPGTGMDISITYAQLEENISTLKNSIAKLKDSWNSEIRKDVSVLDNSWVGEDCVAYTSKLTKMDSKVQKTISALELLCSTYEQARDMVKENQSNIITSISNMN